MKDGSVLLPKYDDYGRAYTYSLSEKSINGYNFKISNDQVVNEYNGGRPMEIEVTKKWTNMDKNSIFPTIKVILHQVFFAKTYGANGTVLQNDGTFAANGNDPKISAVEYATYEKILRNGIPQNCHVVRIGGIGIRTIQDKAQPCRDSVFVADQADDRIVIAGF